MMGLPTVAAIRARRIFGRRPPAGFALIVVIWGLGLISLLALNFAVIVNSQTKATANILEQAKLQAAADGAVALAGLKLSTLAAAGGAGSTISDGRILQLDCRAPDGATLSISAQDEGGKVDINAVDDSLLAKLFVAFGLDQSKAAALVDAVADFRDADELRRVNGAEARDYRAAGLSYGPKNARFDAAEELQQVLGMPPQLFVAVRPYITVYSQRAGIDPQFASRTLLEAAAGLRAHDASDAGAATGPARAAIQIPAEFVAPSSRRDFAVQVVARSPNGAVFVREAVLELVARPAAPFLIRAWRQGRASTKSPNLLSDKALPGC